jgi:hypothetical protein
MATNSPEKTPDQQEKQPQSEAEKPVLPERSGDETDVGWGDRPESEDEDRLYRDRPPHWDDY